MPAQSGLDPLVLVGGVVVQDHMQLPAWVGLGDELEEGQELAVAVAWLAGVGDPAVATSNAANRVVVPCRR
jgi:hypothetical protein